MNLEVLLFPLWYLIQTILSAGHLFFILSSKLLIVNRCCNYSSDFRIFLEKKVHDCYFHINFFYIKNTLQDHITFSGLKYLIRKFFLWILYKTNS